MTTVSGARAAENMGGVCVLAVGAGGIEEMREFLDDGLVAWCLLRMEVGDGAFARAKFVTIHFNGDSVSPVKRGRLNARHSDVVNAFGEVHASMEVKRRRELTIDVVLERLLPLLTSDSLDRGTSAKDLKREYEAQVRTLQQRQPRQRLSSESRCSRQRTCRERKAELQPSLQQIIIAVSATRGAYNWVLLEPAGLELHNAGYGGLDELKQWLDEDKVLFGMIRFSFVQKHDAEKTATPSSADHVKHVFVHWVGPTVPDVQVRQWNMKQWDAEALMQGYCSITMRKETHCLEDLELSRLVSELQRLSVLDDTCDMSADHISVENYMASLSQECIEGIEAEEASDEDVGVSVLPTVVEAVRGVREVGADIWNWALFGYDAKLQLPLRRRPSATISPEASLLSNRSSVDGAYPTDDARRENFGQKLNIVGAAANVGACPGTKVSGNSVSSANVFSSRSSHVGTLHGSMAGIEQGCQTGTAPTGDISTRPNKAGVGALVRTAAHSRPDAWEVKVGTLCHPIFWWERWEFELRKGRLRWWRSQEDFRKRLEPDAKVEPAGDIALVEGEVQWRVSCVPGSARLMLTCYRGASLAIGGEVHTFSAKDEREAREWTEAIEKHIFEIHKLLNWPLPIDGRQGDVRKYGIDYPCS